VVLAMCLQCACNMQGISREGAGESLVGWRKRGNFAASEVMRRASGTDDTNAGRGKMATNIYVV
jgi:hypothetical protein